MKSYASIPKWNTDHYGKFVYGFEKIDGSNFRAEWDRKLSKKSRFTHGFKKFGTRKEAIHVKSPFFEAVDIFKRKMSKELDEIFRTDKVFRNIDRITVFGEFFGESSFAGTHQWDEPHDIKIYDVFLYKKDYLPPSDFMKVFEHIDTPRFIMKLCFNEYVVSQVELGMFDLREGAVFKGVEEGKVFMFKIKTNRWLNRVKDLYGEKKMLEY